MFRVLISIFLIFLISCSNETSDCYGCDLKFLEWTTMDDDGYEWRMNAKAIVREYPWKINLTNVDEYGVPHDEIIPTKGDSIFIDKLVWDSQQFLTDDDVMLVFANTEYNFEDYILDKNKFYDTLRK